MEFNSILREEMHRYLMLRKESCSKSTYDHNREVLKSFDRHLQSAGCESREIKESYVIDWIHTLRGKTSTVAGKVIILRLFLIHLRGYGLSPFIPEIPKIHDDYVPYIYNDDEVKLIINSADNLKKGPVRINKLIHLEMPVIIRLLYGCGLRIGETLSLQVKDVDFNKGCLLLRQTKRKKQRIVPMHHTMTEILHDYCYAMCLAGKPEAYLFPSTVSENPLAVKSAKQKFDSILHENGIALNGRNKHERGPCLHTIRHTFALKSFKQIEEAGIVQNDAIPYLSIYLGHDSLNETEKYLKFSSEAFPEDMDLFETYISSVWPEVSYEE